MHRAHQRCRPVFEIYKAAFKSRYEASWPAAGLVDTEIGCFYLSDAHNAEKEFAAAVKVGLPQQCCPAVDGGAGDGIAARALAGSPSWPASQTRAVSATAVRVAAS